jgi:hypothetical protein
MNVYTDVRRLIDFSTSKIEMIVDIVLAVVVQGLYVGHPRDRSIYTGVRPPESKIDKMQQTRSISLQIIDNVASNFDCAVATRKRDH